MKRVCYIKGHTVSRSFEKQCKVHRNLNTLLINYCTIYDIIHLYLPIWLHNGHVVDEEENINSLIPRPGETSLYYRRLTFRM